MKTCRWIWQQNRTIIVWSWTIRTSITRIIRNTNLKEISISRDYPTCMNETYITIRNLNTITTKDGCGSYFHGHVLVKMNRDATIHNRSRNLMKIDMSIWLFSRKKHWIEEHWWSLLMLRSRKNWCFKTLILWKTGSRSWRISKTIWAEIWAQEGSLVNRKWRDRIAVYWQPIMSTISIELTIRM